MMELNTDLYRLCFCCISYTRLLATRTTLQTERESIMVNAVRLAALTAFPILPVVMTDGVCKFQARMSTALMENSVEL